MPRTENQSRLVLTTPYGSRDLRRKSACHGTEAKKYRTNRMLNTLISAAGVRKSGGAPVDDFGDTSLAKGVVDEIIA